MQEITLDTVRDSIAQANAFAERALADLEIPHKLRMQACIVVDEVFSNIVNYAYGSGVGPATMQVDFDETRRVLTLVFIDEGVPFDPRESKEPDITLALEERPIGGLGLFMVKKMMDEIDYQREGGRNILTVTKRV